MKYQLVIGNRSDRYRVDLFAESDEEKYILGLVAGYSVEAKPVYDGYQGNRKVTTLVLTFVEPVPVTPA